LYIRTTVFITQSNYVGYMFRLLNSHFQAYSLQVKSQDAVHSLGSQCVYISEILKLKYRPEDDCTTVETCNLHNYLV